MDSINIQFLDDGSGVDHSTIVMTVEGTVVTPTIIGSQSDYTLTYDPSADMGYLQVVDVTIDASDLDGNAMIQDAYSFTTMDVNHIAIIETSEGTIKAELYEQRAPITTANFINLAENGFYDGLIFHRVENDFVIQTGDPTGTGKGGSGDTIELEIHEELTHRDGALGMARGPDPNSATSQFYICDGAQHSLDGSYAVFGQVIEGIDVVQAIAEVPQRMHMISPWKM